MNKLYLIFYKMLTLITSIIKSLRFKRFLTKLTDIPFWFYRAGTSSYAQTSFNHLPTNQYLHEHPKPSPWRALGYLLKLHQSQLGILGL